MNYQAKQDEIGDLERMLAPLRRLTCLSGVEGDVARYLPERAESLEVELLLELDRGSPTCDLVGQLLAIGMRLATTSGVVLPAQTVRDARRLWVHAETVSGAWQAVSESRPATATLEGTLSNLPPNRAR